jgi:hypothetical protein
LDDTACIRYSIDARECAHPALPSCLFIVQQLSNDKPDSASCFGVGCRRWLRRFLTQAQRTAPDARMMVRKRIQCTYFHVRGTAGAPGQASEKIEDALLTAPCLFRRAAGNITSRLILGHNSPSRRPTITHSHSGQQQPPEITFDDVDIALRRDGPGQSTGNGYYVDQRISSEHISPISLIRHRNIAITYQ